MIEELKITLSFNKLRFKKTLFKWTAERDCSTCEFEAQKEWDDCPMPLCSTCDKDYWRVNEELFDRLISDCIHIEEKTE